MDSGEVRVLRKQTARFIADNKTTITLTRGGARASDGAGGYTVTPGAPIAAQDFRLVPQNQTGMPQTSDVDSTEIAPQYVMIGAWDADVQIDDVFVLDSRNYEVTFVRSRNANAYETWAEVVYRG